MNQPGNTDSGQTDGTFQVPGAADAMAAAEAAVANAMSAVDSATTQGMAAAGAAVARTQELLAKLYGGAPPPDSGADEPADEAAAEPGQDATESSASSMSAADRAVVAAVTRATESVTNRLIEQQKILDATQASMLAALAATAQASGQMPSEDE